MWGAASPCSRTIRKTVSDTVIDTLVLEEIWLTPSPLRVGRGEVLLRAVESSTCGTASRVDAVGPVLDRARIALAGVRMQTDRVEITFDPVRIKLTRVRMKLHPERIKLHGQQIKLDPLQMKHAPRGASCICCRSSCIPSG